MLLAAVASMVVGTLWYGPLFGKFWIKEMKFTEEQMAKGKKGMAKTYSVALIVALITAYVLSYMIRGANLLEAAIICFWIWLGFIATVKFGDVLWNGKSVKLYIVEASYYLINLLAMAAVITLL